MSHLSRFGVDTASVESQFQPGLIGRTLIVDGDAFCYQVTAKCAKLETAARRFTTKIYEAMYLTRATSARVHLTPTGCHKNGRGSLIGVKPYQGNRKNKEKPPLLEPLRLQAPELFADLEDIYVQSHWSIEADDACMQDAYNIEGAVMWSEDKDLRIAPCPRYDFDTGAIQKLLPGDRFGWISEKYTPSGTLKVIGHGTKFFWAQMLMGDTADNVQGILKYNGVKCGPRSALDALLHVESEDHAVNLVLNAYREIDQNPIPEAEMLWLLRTPDDSALYYMWNLDLTDRNREFLCDCSERVYRKETDDESPE